VKTMPIRHAKDDDLRAIVAIYNEAIPTRMATADTEVVTAEQRRPWFLEHDPSRRPLFVHETGGAIDGWLSLTDYYGGAAYARTAEVSVYVAASARRRGVARVLLLHAIDRAPALGLDSFVGFIFAHDSPSITLFTSCGFVRWGTLPRVAIIDGNHRDLSIFGRDTRALR
jgi:L-amino acid N-acyltransferase YncA